ncbi:MAG TPA: type I restriction endonuclease subunit R [Acidobacteriota bacterium]|nr:type I restriction endonuclease subunit R [Acidobacteriota bacterium]
MSHDPKELLEVEDPAVKVLTEQLGWTELSSQETEAMRGSLKEVVLVPIFQKAIKRLNPWISDENIHRVIRSVIQIQASSTMEANEKIQGMLERGTTVIQDKLDGLGQKSQDVNLIDYEGNNEYHLVRQFRILHYKENKPDIVLFINGLPIVVIECKSPTLRSPMAEGMLQMFRYQESEDKYRNVGCPKLFNTVQIVVSTFKDQTKYATNFTQERHWSEWKEPYPYSLEKVEKELGRIASPQDRFLYGVCSKKNLLDIIQNFIVYEREGNKIVKKVCKYQQYRAVNKLVKDLEKRKSTRGGVIWHTQGSGKSLTMLWTAVKLRRIKSLHNPTLVIVTDRVDLDEQIKGTFIRCGFPNPTHITSSNHLQEVLRDPVGQTVMTTIQKFQESAEDYPVLTESSNVYVLVDEAHRTQYKMLAANMRQAMKNGTFIGFTGTPISKKFRNTIDTFGSYVDVYDHKQAVADGATVPIFYEGRLVEMSVTNNSLDQLFDRIFRDYDEKEREKIKKKYATPEAIATASGRIKLICLNILEHFEKFIAPNNFKAQIVTVSRDAAVKYKQMLDDLGAPTSEVLISKNHNDVEALVPFHKSKTDEQEIIRKFKEEADPKILIVCDKLLTGFDAPVEQVMYLDSPLKEHTLLQAIARVNRTYPNKQYGLIVDYWGISQDLQEALDMFTVEETEGLINLDYKKENLPRLQAAHNVAMNFFPTGYLPDMEKCVAYLEPEDKRATFNTLFLRLSKYMDMLLPDPLALPFVKDFRLLAEIRTRARNRYRDDQLSLDECSEKVKQLIEEHIKAEGITHLIAPTSIFSKSFDEEIKRLSSDEARASEIEHAVKHEIQIKIHEDPIFYESLKERLERIIKDFKEGRINAAIQLKLVDTVLQDMRHPEKHAQEMGIDQHIIPFYNLLKQEMPDKDHKETAKEIHATLDELAVVDWGFKDDVKREMRRRIKRILRLANFDDELIESLTLKLMDLARARFNR